jgi:hypothetical protein
MGLFDELLDLAESHWIFFPATREAERQSALLHCHLVGSGVRGVRETVIPSGILPTAEPCLATIVPRDNLDRATLFPMLRECCGYHLPDDDPATIFPIGIRSLDLAECPGRPG